MKITYYRSEDNDGIYIYRQNTYYIYIYIFNIFIMNMKVAQSCPTLCHRMDYIDLEILQPRILEWVTFPFSRGSSQPKDQTQVSRIAGRFFTS